ncbi:MoaD/ThiS family protein [Dokdonia sp.]|uniref:MoaD/ThiS family protein n=1 Tax=Dokdonia sp. TaxID=2024995 RepID=UPI003263C8DF
MQIEVKYFGMLAEITRCNSEELDVSIEKISELKTVLLDKYPDFRNKDFRIAQNQAIVSEEAILTGQEIAILPPFAGG